MEFRHIFKSSAMLLALCPALSMPTAAGVPAATADDEITFTFACYADTNGQTANKDGQKHYVPFVAIRAVCFTAADGIITETTRYRKATIQQNS